MITTIDNVRDRYQLEEGCTDLFLQQRIAECEGYVADKFTTNYPLWEADASEIIYGVQRGDVRYIVANMVVAVLLRQFGYVFTSFGVVTKRDEYSSEMGEDRRYDLASVCEADASRRLRELCESESVKYNFADDMADKLNVSKKL